MRHARKNRYSFLLLSALLVVLVGCGGGGSTATPIVSSSGSAGWVSVDPVSAPLTSPLVLGGTAWVSDHYVALHCAGLACLFDTSIDNYPGVDVTYVNLTTGETGNATSFYGGGTDWTHLWVATVSIVGGRNTIQVSAYDPSGAGASTTFDVYANLLTSIVVTPADPRIPKGASQQFTATGILTDSTTLGLTSQVTWTSSDASKATIDAAGTASGLAIGSTTITATWKGISGFTTLTIVPAELVSIAISPANATIPPGYLQYPFSAAGTFDDGTTRDITATVHWTSSDTAVAAISNQAGSQGKVDAGIVGTTLITASSGSIAQSTLLTVDTFATITVSRADKALLKGGAVQLSAVGTFPNGSTLDITSQAAWSSSDTSIAVVGTTPGSAGRVTANSAGTATITAAWGTVSGPSTVTVSPWTPQASATTEFLFDVTWTGTQFIAVRSVGLNLASPSGVTWTQRSFDPVMINTLYGDCSCGPRFAAAGLYVFLASADDGASFTTTSTPGIEWYAVTCSASKFVAVGSLGSIMTSTDGFVQSGSTAQLYGAAWSGAKFVVVGGNGTILNSADGVSWTTVQTGGGALRGVTWSGTQFVVVGDGGAVLTSPDGVAWTGRASGMGNRLFAVTWTGTQFVAVGESVTILTSPDGQTWSSANIDGTNLLHGVASSGTRVVVVGEGGMILTLP